MPERGETGPVIVAGTTDANEANTAHGDRYGVDWEYEQRLPFICPHCGAAFGWGFEDVVLLRIVYSVRFDEPAPCCGKRLTGTVTRDGVAVFDEGEPALSGGQP